METQKNLDLFLLQSLSLSEGSIRNSLTEVIDLFACQSFDNLAKLSLTRTVFERPLTLTNVPSLKSLVTDHCTSLHPSLSLPLVFPDDFQLQSLTFWSRGKDISLSSDQRPGEFDHRDLITNS